MKKTIIQPHKSSLGMDANIASLVVFVAMLVVAWIPYVKWVAWGVPIVFFFLEKNSGFVKFQSVYAMIIGIINAAFSLLLQIIIWIIMPRGVNALLYYGRGLGAWVVLGIVATIISVIITIITIYLIVMAYSYKQVELPGIGAIAKKASEKLSSMNFNQQSASQQNPNQYSQPQYQQPPYQQPPYQQPPNQQPQYQQPPNQPPYQQPPNQQPPYQQPPNQQPPYQQPPNQQPQYQQPPNQQPPIQQPPNQQPPNQPAPGQYDQPPSQPAPGQVNQNDPNAQ